jgi:putative transcriptional regulator
VDVKAIRAQTGLSQSGFANRFGFSAAAIKEWEQGRRQPEASARILLLVIAKRPEVVEQVLRESAVRMA